MAAITDLTFGQVEEELPAGAITYVANNDDIVISLSALTGDTFTGLTDPGVCEVIYKLLRACQRAQAVVNADPDLEDGEALLTFPPATNGGFDPTTNQVTITSTVIIALNIDPNLVTGINA